MSYPSVTFRSELDPTTRKELDAAFAQLQGFLSGAGFKADGSFSQGRLDTVEAGTVNADRVVTEALMTPADVASVENFPGAAEATTALRIGVNPTVTGLSPSSPYTPAITVTEDGDVGVSTKTPLGKFVVAYGNVYVSDGALNSSADGYLQLRYATGGGTGVVQALANSVQKPLTVIGAPLTLYNIDQTVAVELKTATVGLTGVPASASGLSTGDLWIDANAGNTVRAVGSSVLGTTRLVARSETQVGNVGGGEDDLISLTVPASTLSENGQQLHAQFIGTFAANANEKRVKVKFGSTTIVDMGTGWTPNGLTWIADVRVIRTGAATQRVSGTISVPGLATTLFQGVTTAAETLSGAVTLKATGESVAATTDDVVNVAGWVELAH